MLSLYDECYNQATYSRVIKCYVEHFAVGLNDQNARYLMQLFNNAISNYTSELNPIPICIEDLNKIIASVTGNVHQQLEIAFEPEQSMDSTGAPTLTQIDINILWLRLLYMCLEKAVDRYEADWKLYRSTGDSQLRRIEGVNIQNFTIQIDCSIINVIALLQAALKAIISRHDELRRTSIEEIDKSIRLNVVKSWSAVNQAAFAEIQVWNDEIVAIIHDTLKLMKAMKKINGKYSDAERKKEFDKISKDLMESLVVMEKQPPEVLQTCKNFSTTIRILLTLTKLKETSKKPVKIMFGDVSIWSYYNDSTVNSSQNKMELPRKKDKIQKKDSEDEHDICYNFDKFKVKQVFRTKTEKENEKRNTVIEHKFGLMYQIQLTVGEKKYTASARSWPVLIIVHQIQEAITKAICMWDKHFPKIVRSKIASVPWDQMRVLLDSFFKTETGFELKPEQLLALYEKLNREKIIIRDTFFWEASSINQPNRTFSFWEWFFSTIKLIRNHIEELYRDGLIDGYVCQSYLKGFPVGTFVIRFSESVLNGLVTEYINFENIVESFKPFEIDGSKVKYYPTDDPLKVAVVDYILVSEDFKTRHDGILKDQAFKEHFKKPSKDNSSNNIVTKYKPRIPIIILNISRPNSSINTSRISHGGITNYNPNSTVFDESVPNYNAVSNSMNSSIQVSKQGIDPRTLTTINHFNNINTTNVTTSPNNPSIQYNMETEAIESSSTSMSNFNVEYSSSIPFMQNSLVLSSHQANVFGDNLLNSSMVCGNEEDDTMSNSSISNTLLNVNGHSNDITNLLYMPTPSTAGDIDTPLPGFESIEEWYY